MTFNFHFQAITPSSTDGFTAAQANRFKQIVQAIFSGTNASNFLSGLASSDIYFVMTSSPAYHNNAFYKPGLINLTGNAFYTPDASGNFSSSSTSAGSSHALTIYISPEDINNGFANVPIGQNGTPSGVNVDRSVSSTLFHELAHAVTDYNGNHSGLGLEGSPYAGVEAVAIAAENYIYHKDVSIKSRVGHSPPGVPSFDPALPFRNVSNVSYVWVPNATLGVGSAAQFSGSDASGGTIYKRYYTDAAFLNYVTVSATRAGGLLSKNGKTWQTFSDVVDGSLASSVVVKEDVKSLATSIKTLGAAAAQLKGAPGKPGIANIVAAMSGFDLSQMTNVSALSDERFTDLGGLVNLVGPAGTSGFNAAALSLSLKTSGSSILLGSSGFASLGAKATGKNDDSNSYDHLVGGNSGHNLLIAGSGTKSGIANILQAGTAGDMLIGGAGNDKLFGSTGADLFVETDGTDQISGSAGIDTLVVDSSTTKVDLTQAGGVVTLVNGKNKTSVSGVEIFVGSSSHTEFDGNGHSVMVAGSGGADFHLKSGDIAIGNPNAKGGNNYYVSSSDKAHVSIIGFSKNDHLFVDGKLFNGSVATATTVGESYDSNHDGPGNAGVYTTVASSWGTSVTNPHLYDTFGQTTEGLQYHYWINGTDPYNPTPITLKDVTYVKSADTDGVPSGDIYFTSQTGDGFGNTTVQGNLDISITGWQQGFGGINFLENNLARDALGAFSIGNGIGGWDGQVLGGGPATAANAPGYYMLNGELTAAGGLFGTDSSEWQSTPDGEASTWDVIDQMFDTIASSASGGDLPDQNPFSGDDDGGGGIGGPLGDFPADGSPDPEQPMTLQGDATANVLDSGGAYQAVIGGGGGDTFQYELGYGYLTIDEQDGAASPDNILQFGAGILPGDIGVSGTDSGDIVLTIDDNDQVTLLGALNSEAGLTRGVQQIAFSDGTVWTYADLLAAVGAATSPGSTIYGDDAANTLDTAGLASTAVGGGGGDTFLFNAGYGSVTIDERDVAGAVSDVLSFGAGVDPYSASVFGKSDGSLVIDFGNGDAVTLANALLSNADATYGVQYVTFDDGTTWTYGDLLAMADTGSASNLSLYGDRSSNDLWGNGIATSLTGGGGGDTFEVNNGDQPITIYESDTAAAPSNQLLLHGFDSADVAVRADAQGDLILSAGGADQVTIAGALNSTGGVTNGVQSVTFDDGTTWAYSDLLAMADTPSVDNRVLYGDGAANNFDPAGLANSIIGGGGGDTFVYDRGYGALSITEVDSNPAAQNSLQFGSGIAPGDVVISGDASGDLILSLGGDDAITLVGALTSPSGQLNGLQVVTFADGTTWSYADLLSAALAPAAAGGTIYGDSGANTLDSSGVAATAVGNGGGDTFVYDSGYGALTISEDDTSLMPNNILAFGAGIDPTGVSVTASSDGSVILNLGGGDIVTLAGQLHSDGQDSVGVQAVTFVGGTIWTAADLLAKIGTATSGGPSTIYGDGNANVLDPAGNAASVVGGGGGDTILFDSGYGILNVDEQDNGGAPDNILQFGSGIDAATLAVTANASGDIVLDAGGGDQVVLKDALNSTPSATFGVQEIVFNDGTVWSYADLMARLDTPSTTNTTLYGDTDSNVLDGGGLADLLVGNGGDDTFVFNQGYGTLTIDERDGGGSPDNQLQLGIGILPEMVSVSANAAGDLILSLGSGDQVTLKSALNSDAETTYGVQAVAFDDGTIWTYDDLLAKADTSAGGSTTLYGDRNANEFDSAGLAHEIVGHGGGDSFLYQRGYGALSIVESDDGEAPANTLSFGAGIAPGDITTSVTPTGDVQFSLGGDDVVTLVGAATSSGSTAQGVQQVTFAGGLSWDAAQIRALATGSWAIADDGQATDIDEAVNYGTSTPTIQLAFASTDTTLALGDDRNSLVLTSTNGTAVTIDDLLRKGVDEAQLIEFSDGVTLSLGDAVLQASNTADVINYQVGTSGAENFDFANGVKEVLGFGGGDTVRYDRGDGYVTLDETDTSATPDNVLAFGPGIALSDLTITSDGQSLYLMLDDGDEVVISNALLGDGETAFGAQHVTFDDGSSATYVQLLAIADTGSANNSRTLFGDANANVIDPAGYSHTVIGSGGSDTIVYNRGYGNLEVADYAPSDGAISSILFGSDITTADIAIEPEADDGFSFNPTPAMNVIIEGEGTISIDNELSGAPVIGELRFADGTTLSYADMLQLLETPVAGRSAIGGDYGANILDTQGLVHEVIGNGGGDTIQYDRGYGTLFIDENDDSTTPDNKLVFAAGINPSDVAVSLSYQGKFYLDLGGGDVVSFRAPQLYPGSGIESVQFADGTTWTSSQLLQIVDTGAPGKISIQGTSLEETFDGQGFTRYIAGASGNDTYVFNRGDGAETIYDSGYSNTIAFGTDIDPDDVTVSEYNGNLILSLGASDRLLIEDQFTYPGAYYGVQNVTFDDGTVWTAADLAARISVAASGSAPAIDSGAGAADTIMLPSTPGGDLSTADTLNFTDADSGDVHQVSVVNVSYTTSSSSALPDQSQMLSYLSAAVATEPDTNPGTIDWSFLAPADAFARLAPGDSVDMTFTLQLKDENNAVTTQNVVVSVVSPLPDEMRSNRAFSDSVAQTDAANEASFATPSGLGHWHLPRDVSTLLDPPQLRVAKSLLYDTVSSDGAPDHFRAASALSEQLAAFVPESGPDWTGGHQGEKADDTWFASHRRPDGSLLTQSG